jgi:hypothetical protein
MNKCIIVWIFYFVSFTYVDGHDVSQNNSVNTGYCYDSNNQQRKVGSIGHWSGHICGKVLVLNNIANW